MGKHKNRRDRYLLARRQLSDALGSESEARKILGLGSNDYRGDDRALAARHGYLVGRP